MQYLVNGKFLVAVVEGIMLTIAVLSFRVGATLQMYLTEDVPAVAERELSNSLGLDFAVTGATLTLNGQVDNEEKPLSTTERNTLLTVIAGLCDYSAIKYDERGAAGKIASMTQEVGAAVSDDTIRNLLKQIPGAVATRMK